mgnify:CR=1 FL=1
MNSNNTGTLIIKPLCAKLRRDTDFFTKMDPYCKLRLGNNVQRTHTANGAGKFPSWNDCLSMKRASEDILIVEIWDKDPLKSSVLTTSSMTGSH